MKLDKGTVSRRVRVALDAGYLVNNETRKGRPSQLQIGDALPEEREVLPSSQRLADAFAGCCSVAGDAEGVKTPPPPPDANSNGYHPELHPWKPLYDELVAHGMDPKEALVKAMREQGERKP